MKTPKRLANKIETKTGFQNKSYYHRIFKRF